MQMLVPDTVHGLDIRPLRSKPKREETNNQIAFFTWLELQRWKYPLEVLLTHASAEGGRRDIRTASIMKKMGCAAGWPDIECAFARVINGTLFHGLRIEMKSKDGRLSESQKKMRTALHTAGYLVVVCHDWIEAQMWWLRYVTSPQYVRAA